MIVKFVMKSAVLACGLLAWGLAHAQTTKYAENFSGIKTQLDWAASGSGNSTGACLTASGNGSNNTGTYTGIPQCTGTSLVYSHPSTQQPNDPAGFGALRLTPAMTYQTGLVLSRFTFPTDQGIQITFTTYTYNGDQGGTAQNGADGIVFMLTDGNAPMPTTAGGSGGALGYSCSNGNPIYQGMANAYLGLGIDEYGNFLNSGDNTDTGILNTHNSGYAASMAALGLQTTALGSNSFYNNPEGFPAGSGGQQYQPMRIGLRGAGNTTWAWLRSKNPTYYGVTADPTKFYAACSTGNYVTNNTGTATAKIPGNYKAIRGGYYVLNQLIASNSGQRRINTSTNPPTFNSAVTPITYKLSISPTGRLNLSFSYNNSPYYQMVLTNHQITDDNGNLPLSFRFGFTAGTGGSDNVHEITCFQATPATSSSSAGGNTVSGQVQVGSQIYLANYTADNWVGTVQAVPVGAAASKDGTTTLGIGAPVWDANCVLTGGYCASTNAGSGAPRAAGSYSPAPQPGGNTTGASRVLLTSNSTTGAGLAFKSGSLDAAEITALGGSTKAPTAVQWLRGDRSTEQLWSSSGTLRSREGVLGDIINSSPVWAGPPQAGAYPDNFKDLINSSASLPENADTSQKFSAYASARAPRQPVVYVGSNDGFLHGFRTGNLAGGGHNDGREVIGFMPAGQLLRYASGLSSPTYAHSYMVDAMPAVGDLLYGKAWHTWLVGGVGSSGQEIYALDVTDPSAFSEANANDLVIGDWTPANTSALNHLGCTVGTPAIARLHDGNWAFIFGNGLPDASGATPKRCSQAAGTYTGGIYIGRVNSATGAVSFKWIDTGVGSSATPNGIAYVAPLDVDGDHIADYAYAGDLLGNLWRFDLTSNDPDAWAVSKFGNPATTPLFKAGQPITTAPVVAAVRTGSGTKPRMMVYFGTGRLIPATTGGAAVYAAGAQAFYGIWDWDWSSTPWQNTVQALPVPQTALTTAHLLRQTATQTANARSLSTTQQVCWADQSNCAGNKQYGWYYPLPDTNEQIIYNPVMIQGGVVVNTAEPPVINAQACNPGRQTGWTMAFDPSSGGGFAGGFFESVGNGWTGDGLHQGAVGSPTVVESNDEIYTVSQTVDNVPKSNRIRVPPPPPPPPPQHSEPGRVSWRELRF